MVAAQKVTLPYPVFTDSNGEPLEGGKIWIGEAGLDPITNPITVYRDLALTQQMFQPIITHSGYAYYQGTPTNLYIAEDDYSITVKTAKNIQVFTNPSAEGIENLREELAAPSGSSLVGFINTGTGAVARTVQDRLRETISVKDFGAVGNGVTDDIVAFERAIASFTNNAPGSYSGAQTIFVPWGTYYLSRKLNISRQITLRGVSKPDGNNLSGSILKFATGSVGIEIHSAATSPVGTDAQGACVEGLVVRTTRNSAVYEAGCYGIQVHTRCSIRDTVVTWFGDNGISIVADSPSVANLWRVDNVRCSENGYNGFYVDGADANAGLADRLDCVNNLQCGVYDSSFLGNTYIAPHTSGNGAACYKTDNANACNVFIGAYSESGYPAADCVAQTLFLGGLDGAGFTPGSTAYRWIRGQVNYMRFLDETFNGAMEVTNNAKGLLTFRDYDDGAAGAFATRLDMVTGAIYFDWADNGVRNLELTNQLATVANGYPREVYTAFGNSGGVSMRAGVMIGPNMLFLKTTSGVPASGTVVKGDTLFNEGVNAAGQPAYAVTTSGVIGSTAVVKAYANVAA